MKKKNIEKRTKRGSWKKWKYSNQANKYLTDEKIKYTIEQMGKKDPKSEKITSKDREKVRNLFRDKFETVKQNNPDLTNKEIMSKIIRETAFTSKENIAVENWWKQLKEFGTNIKKTSIKYDIEKKLYKIVAGKYKGNYTIIVHNPGQEPSYSIILVPEENLSNYLNK